HGLGGRIFEFADKDTSRAAYWDRLLHLYPDGTLHYGVFPPDSAGKPPTTKSSFKILGTSKAYDDGAWHQVAVRLSPLEGQTLFVDGARIANDPATAFGLGPRRQRRIFPGIAGRILGRPRGPRR
ncbi:MAG: hypothetical protein JF616_00235, partial [Fibrobacteres bacterium]|nr:hypothetical protein [Fibrobacterota bacterium]